MRIRDRIIIAYLGLLVLLLLLAGISLSVTSKFDKTIADANLGSKRVISNSTKLYLLLPRISNSAYFYHERPAEDRAGLETVLEEADRAVAVLFEVPEAQGVMESIQRLRSEWEAYQLAIRKMILEEDASARDQMFNAEVRRSAEEVRMALASIVEASAARMDNEAARAREGLKRDQAVLLTITVLGIVLCLGFIAMLGRMLRKPAKDLVEMLDSFAKNNHLEAEVPKPRTEERNIVVGAVERLLGRIQEARRADLTKLARVERRAEHAMDCIPDALAIADRTGKILYSNKTLETLLGKEPETINELPWPHLPKLAEASIATGSPQVFDDLEAAIQLFRNGAEMFYLPGVFPLKADGEAVEEYVILMNDVSYLKQLDEMRVDLISTVSHQLKTPLTSIRMSLHMLNAVEGESISPTGQELVLTALEETERLHTAIQNLLVMARIQSGAIEMNLDKIDTTSWLRELGASNRAMLADRGISLSLEVEPDLPALRVDKLRMAGVIEDILKVAAEHCRKEDRVILRGMADESDPSLVVIKLSDNGPGFKPLEVARLFEKFYLDSGEKTCGVTGLAIAQKVVQAHGGNMICRSALGEGSTFTILLYSTTS